MKPLRDCHLYAFVDSAYLRGRNPVEVAEQLCAGGADIIQLRAKDWDKEKIRKTGENILPITQKHGVRLVINDYADIAREIGAPMCHLGQEDFFDRGYSHVSQLTGTGANLELGLSTHAPDQARRAIEAVPAYVAIGPVYATGTKPSARPVTLEYVRWAAENVAIPWFAIGGINLTNLRDVLNAGATRVCVVSAILNASDVEAACHSFKRILSENA